MQNKNFKKIFETEMWLYLDNTLPKEQMRFWEEKILTEIELQQMLKNAKETLANYSKQDTADVEKSKFDKMINIATSNQNIYSRIKSLFTRDEKNTIPKIAFASILIITSIVFQLISTTPNPVNNFTKAALSWNDKSIDDNFKNISTNISFLENEDFKKYYIYTKTNDEWEQEVISLNQKIEKLLNDSEDYEL